MNKTKQNKQNKQNNSPVSKKGGLMPNSWITISCVIILALSLSSFYIKIPRVSQTVEDNKWFVLENIWPEESLKRLRGLVSNIGTMESSANDVTNKIQHIGEAKPIGKDGKCPHSFLIPNHKNRSQCVLPNRIDVARHYLLYGGRNAHKERFRKIISRALSFSHFIFDKIDDPDIQLLFDSEHYKDKVNAVCKGKNHVDPFQLSIIINVEGQEVPIHYDSPYFWGASRFTFPQWLCICMQQSGLFEDIRIPQIQGVAYLHEWTDSRGGNFFFYPNGPAHNDLQIPPKPNTGIVLDGSTVVHGTDTYHPTRKAPDISKDDRNQLVNLGNGTWHLLSNSKLIKQIDQSDLRISFVWRARCFTDEEEKKRWHENTNELSLEYVLDTLVADLKKRNRIKTVPDDPFKLALILLDEYTGMPISKKSTIPFNYCLIIDLLPFLEPVLGFMC